jgi:cell division protein FtsZ
MTLNLTLDSLHNTGTVPRIVVIGIGGGGTNAVNNMMTMGLVGVEFVVANTDAQSLARSAAERRLQLGMHLTQGLGAGARPEIGRAAAEETSEDIRRYLEGAQIAFITAGMGGGTGTGAAPVFARIARERGVLTIGVVTKPFDFEGPKRRRAAEEGLQELQQHVDTLIVVPNQNLFRTATERTTFAEAFKMADTVLYMGVRGVTDLMVKPGLVNLDFADIRTVMAEMGKAMMGTGEAEGDDRAVRAAEAAINNPLLEDLSLRGARGVLINITGGEDMTLFEFEQVASRIGKEVDGEAEIIVGSAFEEGMAGRIRVSVVATGINAPEPAARQVEAAADHRFRAPLAVPPPPAPSSANTLASPAKLVADAVKPGGMARIKGALDVPTFLRRQRN